MSLRQLSSLALVTLVLLPGLRRERAGGRDDAGVGLARAGGRGRATPRSSATGARRSGAGPSASSTSSPSLATRFSTRWSSWRGGPRLGGGRRARGRAELVLVATAEQRPIILTKPRNVAKLDALLALSDEPFVRATVGSWTAVAEQESDLAHYRAALARGTLQDSNGLGEALDLPEGALARAGSTSPPSARSSRHRARRVGAELDVGVESVAAAISAEDDGLRLSLSMKTAEVGGSCEPQLFRRVPADAVVALSFGGTQGVVDRLQESVDLEQVSAQVEEAVGVSLDRVLDALRGEGLLYVRAGEEGVPEVTLALDPPDRDETLRTIDELARRLAQELDATVEAVRVDGVELRRVEAEGVTLTYGEFDGTVLVTTGSDPTGAFREDGDKLADSDAFERAAERVGLEDRTWLCLRGSGRARRVPRGARRRGAPGRSARRARSLDSFILQNEADGDRSRLSGFVRSRRPLGRGRVRPRPARRLPDLQRHLARLARAPADAAASDPGLVPRSPAGSERGAIYHTGVDVAVRDDRRERGAPPNRTHRVFAIEGGAVRDATPPGRVGLVRVGHFGYGHIDPTVSAGDVVQAGIRSAGPAASGTS